MQVGTPRRRLMRQDERQAQVLRAAAAAFAKGGFSATSMDDVANEAGITRLIVYRHFDSKEDLYKAVLVTVAESLREEFQAGMALEPANRRGVIIRSVLTVARHDPDAFRLLLVHARREPPFVVYHERWWDKAVSVADALIADAMIDPVTKAWAARTLVGYLVDAVLAWLDVGDPSRDEEFVEQATVGLLALYRALAGARIGQGLEKA